MSKVGSTKQHRCPVDGRMFATKQALAQHRSAAHSAPVNIRLPRQQRVSRRNMYPTNPSASVVTRNDVPVTLNRTEFYYSIKLPANAGEGTGYKTFSLDDAEIAPILTRMAKIYDCFRLRRLAFIWKSASNTTKDGQIVFGYDINAKSGVNPITKAKILSLPNRSLQVFASDVKLPVTGIDSRITRYIKASDVARDNPAVLYYYVNTPAAASDQLIGDFYVEYTVDLFGLRPQ